MANLPGHQQVDGHIVLQIDRQKVRHPFTANESYLVANLIETTGTVVLPQLQACFPSQKQIQIAIVFEIDPTGRLGTLPANSSGTLSCLPQCGHSIRRTMSSSFSIRFSQSPKCK